VEFGLQVEDAFEHVLHVGDGGPYRNAAAQVLAQVVRCREVVGMGMGFQNPLHAQTLLFDKCHQRICRIGAGAASLGVVVEY